MSKYWNQEHERYEILTLYLQMIIIWNQKNISEINLDIFPVMINVLSLHVQLWLFNISVQQKYSNIMLVSQNIDD